MTDDAVPRRLNERSGKHKCIRCLREVSIEELLANDHLCEACAAEDEKKDEGGRMKDE